MVNGSNLLTLELYRPSVPVASSVKRPMRSSHSRAVPLQTREARLREAGLSGARALSRLLVALIESLGAQDHLGRRERDWPHGSRLTAFGPTPLGPEIDRAMAACRSAYCNDGKPTVAPPRPPAIAGNPAAFANDAPWPSAPEQPAPAPADATPPWAAEHREVARQPGPSGHAPRATPRPTEAAPLPTRSPPDPLLATADIPAWQRPFIAAPGVRYMRTPDLLLRRRREAQGVPEGEAPIAPLVAKVLNSPDPQEIAAHAFDTDVMDEVEHLSTEDQLAFESRRALPQRMRMMSGFAVEPPQPANDPATAPQPEAAPRKQAFAIQVRAKTKSPLSSSETAGFEAVAAAVPLEPKLMTTTALVAQTPGEAPTLAPHHAAAYRYPSIDLLAMPRKAEGAALTADMLEQNARLLETTLEDFGIRGEIIHVRAGPVVTLYELEPAPGMKSSRVIGLADDIARSMSALSARVAVVPGRNAIGIELPNERRETVYFREMVESEEFGDSKHKLAIALGKTIGGEPVIAELAKMPHLLVAGTTGSGKSVAINTMILSLLYRLTPEQCRLIMVDPKMLELSVYDGIPHLLTPVVTDPKKAVVALKWAVREMEDRYRKMSKLGVRNIDGFNARVTQAKAAGETIMMQVTTGFERDTGKPTTEDHAMDLTALPYIVIIVDEMADLMMVAGKDIEGAIQRLAQMARAAGIHLIMATQRPSVDVITGTIKANFPTRISFQVTSKIDSRTILGEQGAEQLLGQGDMLHMQGGGRIYRVHGPFVSDDEVEKVVAHLKTQGHPTYLDSVTDDVEADAGEDDEDTGDAAVFDKTAMGGGEDEGNLYEQAVKIVLRDKKSSVSYVQRRLQVGYNKAASLIERMEKEGVLGPANHTGKREILAHSRARVISGVAGDDEE